MRPLLLIACCWLVYREWRQYKRYKNAALRLEQMRENYGPR